jgi:hypothetical protein
MNINVVDLHLTAGDVNRTIQNLKNINPNFSSGLISDGYHTFDELYEHRIVIYMSLCRSIAENDSMSIPLIWRSTTHSDGSVWDGWFILGIDVRPGYQISYHLPMSKWDECKFAQLLPRAPEFDGHTSADVLKRLSKL